MSKSLTLWSLNGGRFVGKTPDEEPKPLKWLKSLENPDTPIPDVLVLQDFRVSLLPYLSRLPHFHFAPMTNHLIWGKRELVGIVAASQHPINDIRVECTWGDGYVRDLEGVNDRNQRIEPADVADPAVLGSELRVGVSGTIIKKGVDWRVATTHGAWVRGGVPTAEQMQSTTVLRDFLSADASVHGGLVFAADCNLDKEGKVLRMLEEVGGHDCLPSSITTTLPPTHPGAKFGAKPDRIMTFPGQDGQQKYAVLDVRMDGTPGSDHLMLCATVRKQ